MNTIKIVIFLCLLTIIINYAFHVQIINQDKKLRESAYNFVALQCPQDKTNEWVTTNNITLTWNLTQKT